MTQSSSLTAGRPTSGAIWQQTGWTARLALVLAGSLALALSAKIQVPFWPVPMTMQSAVVLLLGAGRGMRIGTLAVVAYLLEGFAGLPVFAGAVAGPAYMAGPTGGYLLGFVLAAALAGWLTDRGWTRSFGRLTATMVLSHAVLFVPGVLWLAVLFGWEKAIAGGLLPFVAGTVFKTALCIAILGAAKGLFRTDRPRAG
jgi:biotin transport system substrate-specific component